MTCRAFAVPTSAGFPPVPVGVGTGAASAVSGTFPPRRPTNQPAADTGEDR